jgi:hypothetical protein
LAKRTLDVPVDLFRSVTLIAELAPNLAPTDLAILDRARCLLNDGLSQPRVDVR